MELEFQRRLPFAFQVRKQTFDSVAYSDHGTDLVISAVKVATEVVDRSMVGLSGALTEVVLEQGRRRAEVRLK